MSIIGLYEPYPEPPSEQGFFQSLDRVLKNKANPRDETYMQDLFKEYFPGGIFINISENEGWKQKTSGADKIVYLFPDAIGLKSRQLTEAANDDAQNIVVLNGRRRLFRLDGAMKFSLSWRRFIERFLVGEILFAGVFVILTPIFLIIDLIRGRK